MLMIGLEEEGEVLKKPGMRRRMNAWRVGKQAQIMPTSISTVLEGSQQ